MEMHTYTTEFYSVVMKHQLTESIRRRMESENTIPNELTQAQKVKRHVFSHICGS